MTTAHTATPWKKRVHANGFSIIAGDDLNGDETVIARQLIEADADRIIADRNAHADLVKALQGYVELLRCPSSPQRSKALQAQGEIARAALAKAGAA